MRSAEKQNHQRGQCRRRSRTPEGVAGRTVVVEDLHAGLEEFHGRRFQVLLALVEAGDDFGRLGAADQHRQAGHGTAHEVLHPTLRTCSILFFFQL